MRESEMGGIPKAVSLVLLPLMFFPWGPFHWWLLPPPLPDRLDPGIVIWQNPLRPVSCASVGASSEAVAYGSPVPPEGCALKPWFIFLSPNEVSTRMVGCCRYATMVDEWAYFQAHRSSYAGIFFDDFAVQDGGQLLGYYREALDEGVPACMVLYGFSGPAPPDFTRGAYCAVVVMNFLPAPESQWPSLIREGMTLVDAKNVIPLLYMTAPRTGVTAPVSLEALLEAQSGGNLILWR